MVVRYVYMSPSSQIARPNVAQQQPQASSSDGGHHGSTTTAAAAFAAAGGARKRSNREGVVVKGEQQPQQGRQGQGQGQGLPALTTRARHRKRCREEAGDVLAEHFGDVAARAAAALEMVQATEQHREEAERLLARYKDLLAECHPRSVARLSRKWLPFKSADFENADDVILVCRDLRLLTRAQHAVFKRQLRRLNSHLTGLVAEVDSALVLTGFLAKPLTVEDIRWVLREYKKLLTGALLDFFQDVGLDNDDDDGGDDDAGGGPSDNSRVTTPSSSGLT